jgi:hypothetical protein
MRLLAMFALLLSLPVSAASVEIKNPAPAGSGTPFLAATNDGRLLMSWSESEPGGGSAVRFATFDGKAWASTRTVAHGRDVFVNRADFPSVIAAEDGTLFAHWLQPQAGHDEAYDVRVSSSSDGGKSWRPSHLLNTDGKAAEHGFVSFVALPKHDAGIAWLDGRNTHGEGHGDMMMRYARLTAALEVKDESAIDARTCECCATGMTRAGTTLVAAWRDRSPDEIRDIAVSRMEAGKWSAPALVHTDNWKIAGCPVNGPQVDASGDTVVAAWFTAAGAAKVQASFSNDRGAHFGAPVRIDGGTPAGRVDAVMLDRENAIVFWIEDGKPSARVMARKVSSKGSAGAPIVVANTASARSTGFPRAARATSGVYVAWTDPTAKRVRLARVN